MRENTFIIVGAGLAGQTAADTLRTEGFEGRVILVGEEAHAPYTKPPLSKAVLRSEAEPDSTLLRPSDWYDDEQVELSLGVRAESVDPADRVVVLADGRRLPYDKVLLATGGAARNVAVPGSELEGVYTLRTLDDSLAIRQRLSANTPVVVIGAGFIGAEVAASARMLGCDVTVLEIADVPLGRVLGPQVGHIYTDIHRDHGVDVRTGVGVERIEGDGRVQRVVATDGSTFDTDTVVVGVGIAPDIGPAEAGALEVGNGIIVNELCETSVPDVYAAGDVAFHPNPILGVSIRVEQWQNAQHQGAAAARSMLGQHVPFAEVPWFWSDQYDLNLQMAGLPSGSDRLVFRGDVDAREFSVFYLRDGVLDAVVGVNRVQDVRAGRRLVGARATPAPEALADESVKLVDLLPPKE